MPQENEVDDLKKKPSILTRAFDPDVTVGETVEDIQKAILPPQVRNYMDEPNYSTIIGDEIPGRQRLVLPGASNYIDTDSGERLGSFLIPEGGFTEAQKKKLNLLEAHALKTQQEEIDQEKNLAASKTSPETSLEFGIVEGMKQKHPQGLLFDPEDPLKGRYWSQKSPEIYAPGSWVGKDVYAQKYQVPASWRADKIRMGGEVSAMVEGTGTGTSILMQYLQKPKDSDGLDLIKTHSKRLQSLPPRAGQVALTELAEGVPEFDPAFLATVGGVLLATVTAPAWVPPALAGTAAAGTAATAIAGLSMTGALIQELAQIITNHPDAPPSIKEAFIDAGKEGAWEAAYEIAGRMLPYIGAKFLPKKMLGRVTKEADAAMDTLENLIIDPITGKAKRGVGLTLSQALGGHGAIQVIENMFSMGIFAGRLRRTKLVTQEELSKFLRIMNKTYLDNVELLHPTGSQGMILKEALKGQVHLGRSAATHIRHKLIDLVDGQSDEVLKTFKAYGEVPSVVQEQLFDNLTRDVYKIRTSYDPRLGVPMDDVLKMDLDEITKIIKTKDLNLREITVKDYPEYFERTAKKKTLKEIAELESKLGKPVKREGRQVVAFAQRKPTHFTSLEDAIKLQTELGSKAVDLTNRGEKFAASQITTLRNKVNESIMGMLGAEERVAYDLSTKLYNEMFKTINIEEMVTKFVSSSSAAGKGMLEELPIEKLVQLRTVLTKGPVGKEWKKAGMESPALGIWKFAALKESFDTSLKQEGRIGFDKTLHAAHQKMKSYVEAMPGQYKGGVEEILNWKNMNKNIFGGAGEGVNLNYDKFSALFGKDHIDDIKRVLDTIDVAQREPLDKMMSNAIQFVQIPAMVVVGTELSPLNLWAEPETRANMATGSFAILITPAVLARIFTSKATIRLFKEGMEHQLKGRMGAATAAAIRLSNMDEVIREGLQEHVLRSEVGPDEGEEHFQKMKKWRLIRKNIEQREQQRHFRTKPAPRKKDKRVTPPMGLIPGIGG